MMKTVLIGLIRLYQLVLSPWIGHQCRFTPTCSHYTIAAIQTHGAIKGVWLGLRRIARCHPFSQGGHDPVPKTNTHAKERSVSPAQNADHPRLR